VTLVDSSVWIDHWRRGNLMLAGALERGHVAVHPFVIGELACGNMPNRTVTLRFLDALPKLSPARHNEVMTLVESAPFWGSGLGWLDAHLLAAAKLNGAPLWTLDKALRHAARRLGIHEEPEA
jgi:predicted nucleic acid-binding protein